MADEQEELSHRVESELLRRGYTVRRMSPIAIRVGLSEIDLLEVKVMPEDVDEHESVDEMCDDVEDVLEEYLEGDRNEEAAERDEKAVMKDEASAYIRLHDAHRKSRRRAEQAEERRERAESEASGG